MRPYLEHPGPWLVAHRGGSLVAPENTFAAFDLAASLGADAIETDVRLTCDRAVVVFHDDDTVRLLGVPGTIEDRPRDELRRLDAGAHFTPDGKNHPFRGQGLTVPTLAEALDRYPHMRFNLDAKTEDPELARAISEVVTLARAEDRVCVGSFSDAQAERLGVLLPRCARFLPEKAARCHFLAARTKAPGSRCPSGYDLADLPSSLDGTRVVDGELLAYFHRLGIPVHVWTVDDEVEMRELIALGVDGIVTDRPDVLRQVLGH